MQIIFYISYIFFSACIAPGGGASCTHMDEKKGVLCALFVFLCRLFFIYHIYFFSACGASKKTPVADLRLFLAPPAEWIPDITDSSGKDDEDRDKLRSTNKSENK